MHVMSKRNSILESLIEPEEGTFSPELAEYVLSLGFSERQQARVQALSRKAQAGKLSEDEAAELDEFLEANSLLIVLKSKARRSLKRRSPAA
jgi:hypothetical protein